MALDDQQNTYKMDISNAKFFEKITLFCIPVHIVYFHANTMRAAAESKCITDKGNFAVAATEIFILV